MSLRTIAKLPPSIFHWRCVARLSASDKGKRQSLFAGASRASDTMDIIIVG
jgi:hypothetical protein